jgi:hypothetical protein
MRPMEPDRFDDVEFRVLESPEPSPRPPRSRRRRHGRLAIACAVSGVTALALAAGASALTDRAEAPTAKPGQARSLQNGAWKSFSRHECHRGKLGHRRDQGFDDSARY